MNLHRLHATKKARSPQRETFVEDRNQDAAVMLRFNYAARSLLSKLVTLAELRQTIFKRKPLAAPDPRPVEFVRQKRGHQ
jgi:hypothetical protein